MKENMKELFLHTVPLANPKRSTFTLPSWSPSRLHGELRPRALTVKEWRSVKENMKELFLHTVPLANPKRSTFTLPSWSPSRLHGELRPRALTVKEWRSVKEKMKELFLHTVPLANPKRSTFTLPSWLPSRLHGELRCAVDHERSPYPDRRSWSATTDVFLSTRLCPRARCRRCTSCSTPSLIKAGAKGPPIKAGAKGPPIKAGAKGPPIKAGAKGPPPTADAQRPRLSANCVATAGVETTAIHLPSGLTARRVISVTPDFRRSATSIHRSSRVRQM